MRATPQAGLLSLAFLALPVLVGACGGSDEERTVRDEAGRTCKVIHPFATCDATPAPTNGCVSPAKPTFNVGTLLLDPEDFSSGVEAICASCYNSTTHTSTSTGGDCSAIVCQKASDCAVPVDQCVDGHCI